MSQIIYWRGFGGGGSATTSTSLSSSTTAVRTGNSIITGALQRLSVLQAGEVPTADDLQLGLIRLNEMLDGWNTENLCLPVVAGAAYPLVNTQRVYTIGATGDFVAERPQDILQASIIPENQTYEVPIGVLTREQYNSLPMKDTANAWPQWLTYEPTVPNGTVTVYPVPNTAAELVLYTRTLLTQFATASAAYAFAPGYMRALRDNLALELSLDFTGGQVPPPLEKMAMEGKANLKRANITIADMSLDPGALPRGSGHYSIYSDT